MSLDRIAGLAALLCAATYLAGFALLVTLLAPMGYGTNAIDIPAVVAFNHDQPLLMIAWNSTIYLVNALALAVLVTGMRARLRRKTHGWAAVTQAFGLIWATLVLGAGMIANVAVERVGVLYPENPEAAIELWTTMHAVELGLGGGNEIAGGVWILTVSLAGLVGKSLLRLACYLGLLVGLSGIVTILPVAGDIAGAVFGLGAILWFIVIGFVLLAGTPDRHGSDG